jgi:hypothetical protein
MLLVIFQGWWRVTEHPNPEHQAFYNLGWENAINMVLDVIGEMYNEYDQATLEELRQRIV